MTDVIVIYEDHLDVSWVVDVVSPDRFGDYIGMAKTHLIEMLKCSPGYMDFDFNPVSTEVSIKNHGDDIEITILVDFQNGVLYPRTFWATRKKVNDFLKPAFN